MNVTMMTKGQKQAPAGEALSQGKKIPPKGAVGDAALGKKRLGFKEHLVKQSKTMKDFALFQGEFSQKGKKEEAVLSLKNKKNNLPARGKTRGKTRLSLVPSQEESSPKGPKEKNSSLREEALLIRQNLQDIPEGQKKGKETQGKKNQVKESPLQESSPKLLPASRKENSSPAPRKKSLSGEKKTSLEDLSSREELSVSPLLPSNPAEETVDPLLPEESGKGEVVKLEDASIFSRSGKVEVLDQRRSRSRGERGVSSEGGKIKPALGGEEASSGNGGFIEADLDVSPEEIRILKGTNRASAAETLAARLKGDSGTEIVRQVKVLLAENNSGEIKLNLRPPELGRVRLRLHLKDKNLSGRILVESGVARDAFRGSLDSLVQRLESSGFHTKLDLSMDGSFPEGGERQAFQPPARQALVSKEFEDNISVLGMDDLMNGQVNLVV